MTNLQLTLFCLMFCWLNWSAEVYSGGTSTSTTTARSTGDRFRGSGGAAASNTGTITTPRSVSATAPANQKSTVNAAAVTTPRSVGAMARQGSQIQKSNGNAANNAQSNSNSNPKDKNAAVQDPKCLLPKETGPCRMRLERYYFNADTQTCETFVFGGCRGNDNKFGFKQTCEEACLPGVRPVVGGTTLKPKAIKK